MPRLDVAALQERSLRLAGREVPGQPAPGELLRRLRTQVLQQVEREGNLGEAELCLQLWHLADRAAGATMPAEGRAELVERLRLTLFDLGVLGPLLRDPAITEVMVNGAGAIFVERNRHLEEATDAAGRPLCFDSEADLRQVIDRIVSPLNRPLDDTHPIADARLPDGSRVAVVLPPVSVSGPVLSIRRFPPEPFSLDGLVAVGALPAEAADLLRHLVASRLNLVISGGTSSGKTTFLNALCLELPPRERLVVVEDSAELNLPKARNCIRLETRPPLPGQAAGVSIRDLVRSALRLRPDRILVGEVRGGEAFDMLVAMNTGHDGSLTTAHANSPADMLRRLEAMVLMAGVDMPLLAIRYQVTAAVDVIVQLHRLPSGERRVTAIAEVGGPGAEVGMRPLWVWQPGPDTAGGGRLVPTGECLLRQRLTGLGDGCHG